MALTVNTNVSSLSAQRSLTKSSQTMGTTLQRLASGLRINSAKDDAAGMAISNRMTTQIRGLNQAARNANDGISMAQTAEGALGETTSALQRLRELAIQSANGTNSTSDRAALNAEADQLIAEIDLIASTTEFNGLKLLDGTFGSQTIQVGANASQTISVSIAGATASLLGANATTTSTGTTVADAKTAGSLTSPNGVLKINGTTITTATDGVSTTDATASGKAVAAGINALSGTTKVTATVNATTATMGTVAASTVASGELVINGVNIIATSVSGDSDGALRAAINAVSNQTGVSASLDGSSNLILTATDGRNIRLGTDGTNAVATLSGFALNGAAANDDVVVGTVTLNGDAAFVVDTGIAKATHGMTITANTYSVSTTNAVTNVDLTTASNATTAITNLDRALDNVNSLRGNLGAVQVRFESTINRLTTTSENLSAARSRIVDADFASETAELTRNQILQQAGTAILAQANQQPQLALQLLR
ncbi:MAG: flagellin [Nitrospirae bacterium]|nr:flagellin [Nitrospirota bacterium]